MSDAYWTHDTALFAGRFKYFSRDLEPVQVRGKVHTQQERFYQRDINQEITPINISVEPGTKAYRTYLHMKPFVLVPDSILTIGLYPVPRPGGEIGEVVSAQERRQKEVEIGNTQAWSYPDGTLVLWECFLHDFVRIHALPDDPNMAALWRSVEAFLLGQFSRAEQIVTTAFDPMFDRDEYQAFLTALGYAPMAKAAYGKVIQRETMTM